MKVTTGLPKPYKYTRRSNRAGDLDLSRLPGFTIKDDDVPLTGWVSGLPASDLEERVSRAFRLFNLVFAFQVPFDVAGQLPETDKMVDFVVQVGGIYYPTDIDGEIGHSTSAQQGRDAIREVLLNEKFRNEGLMPLTRIKWWQLASQIETNATIRRIYGV